MKNTLLIISIILAIMVNSLLLYKVSLANTSLNSNKVIVSKKIEEKYIVVEKRPVYYCGQPVRNILKYLKYKKPIRTLLHVC